MSYSIQEVSIEGVRGINDRLSLRFRDGVNLLYGPNGSGKSSILQSIEWCLTGKISYFTGPEFAKEDAVVNPFHPRQMGEVSATLKHASETVTVTRRKKMGKSTARGASVLEIRRDGQVLEGTAAEGELSRMLGIGIDDFPRVIYLHQESVRDLVITDPLERSRAIDRLLGTIELRDVAEAVDAKRSIGAASKGLQSRISVLERDKIQFAVRMRERLTSTRDLLLQKGYADAELSLENVAASIGTLVQLLETISAQLDAPRPEVKVPGIALALINQALADADKSLGALDRFRIKAHQNQEENRLHLQTLATDYETAKKELEEFGGRTPESILGEKTEVEREINRLKQELEGLQEVCSNLETAKMRLESTKREMRIHKEKMSEIEHKYGDEANHLKLLENQELNLRKLRETISRYREHDQILGLALRYIRQAEPTQCPVCGQPIDYRVVQGRIESEVKAQLATKVDHLTKEEKIASQVRMEIESSLQEYQGAKVKLAEATSELDAVLRDIGDTLGQAITLDIAIDEKIDDSKQMLKDHQAQMTSLMGKQAELALTHSTLVTRQGRLRRVESLIQEATCSSERGKALLALLENKLEILRKRIVMYQDTTQLDVAVGKLARAKEVCKYLEDKQEVEEVEEELPHITALVQDLKRRTEQLQVLEGSLDAIRIVTLQQQKDSVVTTLGSFQDLINRYFGAILCHPYFAKLQLDIERERPLVYSVKALGVDQAYSTYIPTRFSHAQMNAAAISLFLSNNTKLAGEFPIVLMDDPAQSIDPEHKVALANVIGELSQKRQVVIATQDAELRDALGQVCKDLCSYHFAGWSQSGPSLTASD